MVMTRTVDSEDGGQRGRAGEVAEDELAGVEGTMDGDKNKNTTALRITFAITRS